jgi:hypothetical protein
MAKAGSYKTIPAEKVREMNGHLEAAMAIAQAFDPGLNAAARRRLRSIATGKEDFVHKANDNVAQHPELVPPIVKRESFDSNLNSHDEFSKTRVLLAKLDRSAKDSDLVASNNAEADALDFMHSVKRQGRAGDTAAEAVYDQLNAAYPGRKGKGAKSSDSAAVR